METNHILIGGKRSQQQRRAKSKSRGERNHALVWVQYATCYEAIMQCDNMAQAWWVPSLILHHRDVFTMATLLHF